MEFYEVYVYEYGSYVSTIFIRASDNDDAAGKVEVLNSLDGEAAFQLIRPMES